MEVKNAYIDCSYNGRADGFALKGGTSIGRKVTIKRRR